MAVAPYFSYFCIAFASLGASHAAAQGTGSSSQRSIWSHNGSTVYLEASGASRSFHYESPSDGMKAAGAREGSILFNGRSVNGRYVGTAYIFNRRCGQYPYEVSGPILDNYERVLLQGQAPRLGSDCKPRGFVLDTLEFTLVHQPVGQSATAQHSLPPGFIGVWQGGAEGNVCKALTWDARDRNSTEMIKVSDESLLGWEFACKINSVKRADPVSGQQMGSVAVDLTCGGEGGVSWNSAELWTVLAASGRKRIVMTPLKVFNTRDNDGRPTRDPGPSQKTPAEFLECN